MQDGWAVTTAEEEGLAFVRTVKSTRALHRVALAELKTLQWEDRDIITPVLESVMGEFDYFANQGDMHMVNKQAFAVQQIVMTIYKLRETYVADE